MIYHQFVGQVVKRTEQRRKDETVTTVTAEFPDQVNPEYQYTKEKLTFISDRLKIGDVVRIVVMDVPTVSENEITEGEYIPPSVEA